MLKMIKEVGIQVVGFIIITMMGFFGNILIEVRDTVRENHNQSKVNEERSRNNEMILDAQVDYMRTNDIRYEAIKLKLEMVEEKCNQLTKN